MKYIQSFYQYPGTFSSIGKTIPARSAQGEMRNICEITENELEKLTNCEPFYRELLNKKKIRVLNHIPASYVPPAQQINEARGESEKLRVENEALKARLAKLEKESEKTEETPAEAETEEKSEEAPTETKKTTKKRK